MFKEVKNSLKNIKTPVFFELLYTSSSSGELIKITNFALFYLMLVFPKGY